MKPRFYTEEELKKRANKVELNPTNKLELYNEAAKNGMTVSALLETMDPSDENDTSDAFERQLMARGIRTKSVPEKGIYASKVENFYASDQPQSVILFPEFINRTMRASRQAQDITSEIIAVRTGIDSDTYRTIYLDTSDVTKFRKKRVAEGSEVPKVKMSTSEHTIDLHKYGIALEASYEAIRRMQIDMLRVHLDYIGLQTGIDRASGAVDVAINGDGNNNAAEVITAVSIDSAATTGITYKAWIGFLMDFYPHTTTTVVGNKASLLEMLTLSYPGADPMMLLASQTTPNATGMRVQLQDGIFTTVKLVLLDSMPAKTLLGIDKGYAIEEVSEIGADIVETDKIINRQLNEVVLTEVVGHGKLYAEATKVLTFA